MKVSLCLAFFLLAACTQKSSETPQAHSPASFHYDSRATAAEKTAYFLAFTTGDDYWKKRWWLEKAARTLRGGIGLTSADDVDALMKLSEAQIVDGFVSDARFADMTLDFNMSFLGFRADTVRKADHSYNDNVFNFPSAVESARQVAAHGDFLKLFDVDAPIYVSTPAPVRDQGDEKKSDAQVMQEKTTKIMGDFRALLDRLNQDSSLGGPAVCEQSIAYWQNNDTFLQEAGVPISFILSFEITDIDWGVGLMVLCQSPDPKREDILARLEKIYALFGDVLNQSLAMVVDQYHPKTVSEIRSYEFSKENGASRALAYGFKQKSLLSNSSTNYNRKRAAYVLKHFFCDDLNPIGVENPKDHTSGAHGSDPACMACHYKLDPMAGYFRNRGIFFFDFSVTPFIIFDDQARANLGTYVQEWKAPQGSPREWAVGYIRSTEDEKLNSYGSTLDDLHELLHTAPEVRRCLVKRMFEYVVSDQQTIDGSFLDYLTAGFNQRASENSTDAFKWLTSQMVLSQSFNQTNPDPSACYDYGPGYDPSGRPPCRVAYILDRNCASCHSSTKGPKHLALNGWMKLSDGTFNFPHLDADGNQLPANVTMQRILDRLSDGNPGKRMPPAGKYLSSQDRQDLYLWAQKIVAGGNTP
jgi:hypothetical protein